MNRSGGLARSAIKNTTRRSNSDKPLGRDECRICHATDGHWAKDCPQRPKGNGGEKKGGKAFSASSSKGANNPPFRSKKVAFHDNHGSDEGSNFGSDTETNNKPSRRRKKGRANMARKHHTREGIACMFRGLANKAAEYREMMEDSSTVHIILDCAANPTIVPVDLIGEMTNLKFLKDGMEIETANGGVMVGYITGTYLGVRECLICADAEMTLMSLGQMINQDWKETTDPVTKDKTLRNPDRRGSKISFSFIKEECIWVGCIDLAG